MEEEEYIKWTMVTLNELNANICFKILMEIACLPSPYNYWKRDP